MTETKRSLPQFKSKQKMTFFVKLSSTPPPNRGNGSGGFDDEEDEEPWNHSEHLGFTIARLWTQYAATTELRISRSTLEIA